VHPPSSFLASFLLLVALPLPSFLCSPCILFLPNSNQAVRPCLLPATCTALPPPPPLPPPLFPSSSPPPLLPSSPLPLFPSSFPLYPPSLLLLPPILPNST
jgi:hypothetical protein